MNNPKPAARAGFALSLKGKALRLLAAREYSRAELEAFFAVKRAFDTAFLLNPDKAIPTLQRCAEYGKMHVRNGQLKFPDLPRF